MTYPFIIYYLKSSSQIKIITYNYYLYAEQHIQGNHEGTMSSQCHSNRLHWTCWPAYRTAFIISHDPPHPLLFNWQKYLNKAYIAFILKLWCIHNTGSEKFWSWDDKNPGVGSGRWVHMTPLQFVLLRQLEQPKFYTSLLAVATIILIK